MFFIQKRKKDLPQTYKCQTDEDSKGLKRNKERTIKNEIMTEKFVI